MKSLAPYAIPTAIGAGALYQNGQQQKQAPQYKKGGVIKDNRGQWAHPGEITEIGSNNITMQGVNYPVLGVSDQGDTQMMYPEQNYQFKGNKVTEYPMMQNGGKVNTLEGDLISKVIMNRNRDKNFVNRAYALGQNPGMFSVQDPENFGNVMSHKMAYGEDDSGQAYMYPTIMNNNNEAIKVPNQYADYISSEGYKKETNMEYGKGGYTVKKSSDRKGKTHVVIGPDGTKKYFGDPNLGERGKSKYGKEAFYARHKKNLDANPYFRAYARKTWEDGGMIPEEGHITMKKRSLFKYGGLTVTDLNKYQVGGMKLGNNSSTITPSSSATKSITGGASAPSSTGANVGAGVGIASAAMPMIEELIPDKTYTDDEGNDLGSRKSIGESALSGAASGAQMGMALGPKGALVGAVIGGGYGAVKGWMEKGESALPACNKALR